MTRERESLLPKKPAKQRGATKLVVALVGTAALALATVAVVPRTSKGLRASPATLKAEALKSGLVKDVDKSRWAPECLAWWQMGPEVEVSSYHILAMPSGICPNTLYCAFENCAADANDPPTTPSELAAATGDMEQIAEDLGVKFNLPDQIAFPTSVKDVVDVVNYARKASMPITVKTSGHSYHGSSTLAGSVNVNMREFPKYSQIAEPGPARNFFGSLPAVQPCDMTEAGFESPAACALALARGKPGVIRVGGGELWDTVYRAVDDANHMRNLAGKDLYELFGGDAGSVSAAGGWMAGGGIGDGSERVFGVGAANVLELEMVLPSGEHVKFAPSKWKDDPGFLYPKTTEVTGLCNKNVVTDESEWKWEACEVEVPWDDLWYAVRGGGGGSYGIVVALTYQLHKRRGATVFDLDESSYTDVCPTKYFTGSFDDANLQEAHKIIINSSDEIVLPAGCKEVQDAFTDFWVDFLWDPAAIGLAEETSLNCGNSGLQFAIARFEIDCYFYDGYDYDSAPDQVWASFWKNYTGPVPTGMDVDKWQGALTYADKEGKAYATANLGNLDYEWFNPEGRVESDAALTLGIPNSWSAIIPPAWFLQKNDDVHNAVMEPDATFHIMGGNVGKLHDQMTSLSEIYWISGAQHQFSMSGPYWFPKVAAFYPEAPEGKLLGGAEYNHIGSDSFGPLKDDLSAYCPGDLTHAKREKKCVSVQEHVWGTDGLAKLQAIKAKVDPQGLFQCQKCVGFKGPVRDQ